MQLRAPVFALIFGLSVLTQRPLYPDEADRAREFFESRIRPALVEYCYECHNSVRREGGLSLDSRAGVQSGGDRQQKLVAAGSKRNLILEAMRHDIDDLKMPEGGAKLSPETIADFEKWFAAGADDPRDTAPSPDQLEPDQLRAMVFAERAKWWAWQPLAANQPPEREQADWPVHPIDRFTFDAMRKRGQSESSRASPTELLRRLNFVLVGLPPTVRELADFEASNGDNSVQQAIDRLLDSPQFGERWARHWMDWLRYAESHGSEGDPAIPFAFRYRDYLIRALNADVPYDQLIVEHVAGDMLPNPRINSHLGVNESAIGPAHFRMVFHGFAPTDALEEKIRFIDDQVATLTKAFLGLTVACARCHDHKFDAIRQTDYYALSGILGSCHPGIVDVNTEELQQAGKKQLLTIKQQVRPLMAAQWLDSVESIFARLTQPDAALAAAIAGAKDNSHPLYVWKVLNAGGGQKPDSPLSAEIIQLLSEYKDCQNRARAFEAATSCDRTQDLALSKWYAHGNGACEQDAVGGEFILSTTGQHAIDAILPKGRFSHLLSTRHRNAWLSPRVQLTEEYDLWLLVAGDDASLRYVVQDYPRDGTVYPVVALKSRKWSWQKFDLSYWRGDAIHIELATAGDAPVLAKDIERSWFGLRDARLLMKGASPPPSVDFQQFEPLVDQFDAAAPPSRQKLLASWSSALTEAIKAWRDGHATDSQALWLSSWLGVGLLPLPSQQNYDLKKLAAEYRKVESKIPLPTRAPGVWETAGADQPLYVRGDHRQAGQPVPRGFVSVLDAHPYKPASSGRIELAESLTSASKPLVARVIVNRLWHHLFGRGLVATPDNFGKLGSLPSHPELLDYLAQDLIDSGWSLKQTIRLIVSSHTWQQTSRVTMQNRALDPENIWLARAPLRRLEAESIRDAQLVVAGQLNAKMFGPSVAGNEPRRSIYLRVFRNSLDPELRVFDFPEPTSTIGRRDVTNVPAQSLMLLNNPQVRQRARAWAKATLKRIDNAHAAASSSESPLARSEAIVHDLFQHAFSREPDANEVREVSHVSQQFVEQWNTNQIKHQELKRQMSDWQKAEAELIQPVRERLYSAIDQPISNLNDVPQPIASWEFEKLDAIFNAKVSDKASDNWQLAGELVGDARLEEGALVTQDGFMKTAPLPLALRAKTLEAWVQVSDLSARGGGVMSVQSSSGEFFDAIVLGEQTPGEWLAGSDHFARTKPFGGPAETLSTEAIHLAITYSQDGRITGYRNGELYGQSYSSAGLQTFDAGDSVITFGLRHLPAGGNRHLNARWERARLYDHALTAAEIASSYRALPHSPSETEVFAQLTAAQREWIDSLRAKRKEAQSTLKELSQATADPQELSVWTEIALAMLNAKEFIFIK